MKLFLCAIAISLLMEGAGFALFPDLMRNALIEITEQPADSLRKMGVLALVSAIILLFLAARIS